MLDTYSGMILLYANYFMSILQTVLYVEDDESDVLFMRQALKKVGLPHSLQVVYDGDDAIAYLEGRGKYADRRKYPFPSLVFLDLTLPVVTGLKVLQWVRKQHSMLALPIVVLSGSRMEFDLNNAYKYGANAYLIKPSNGDDLDDLLGMTAKYWLTLNIQIQAPLQDGAERPPGDDSPQKRTGSIGDLIALAQKTFQAVTLKPTAPVH